MVGPLFKMELRTQLWRAKRLLRRIVPAKIPQPDWKQILGADFEQWRRIRDSLPADAPRVLLAPTVGTPGIVTLDSLLAIALTLRGARVDVLLCDELLPACQNSLLERVKDLDGFLRYGPQGWLCGNCHKSGYDMLTSLGVGVRRMSETITKQEVEEAHRFSRSIPREDIAGYTLDGMKIGEHTLAGAIRFFAQGVLEREESGEEVLRRYLAAGIISARSVTRLMQRERYAAASFHHGIYIPQGAFGEVARKYGSRVVNWAVAYRRGSFIFSHHDTYHHTLLKEPVENWRTLPWTDAMETELLDYLRSRWTGAKDWVSFNRSPELEREVIAQTIGIDFSKPTIGLLTNVMWDAQLHYPQNAFKGMFDWLLNTLNYFKSRPDLQLLVRVHPAEVVAHVRSRQPVLDELKKHFPTFPPNVFVIPPDSPISTYAAMMECDSVLIYGTKTGVELTSFGIPVIVAGEAWIRNKGLTIDVESPEQYHRVLDGLPLRRRLTEEQTRDARRYAYHFFFRRMIPLRVIKPVPPPSWSPYEVAIDKLDDLRPGRDAGLDVICDGILGRKEFIYQAETVPWPSV
jgi:hypothetical protein